MIKSGSKVISFSSGKGGVGKTTMVANLGHLWAKRQKKILLIDGDWNLGKLSICLGARPVWTVDQVISGQIDLARAIHPISENISLLASPSGIVGFEELTEGVRNQLYFEIDSLVHDFDLVLFDHSSGVNWGVLQFAAAAHEHVIITTSEPTSYTDAYAIMKILSKRFGVREFQLLVTMSPRVPETESTIFRFSEVVRHHLNVRVNLLDIFPWEPKLAESIRRQRAFVELFPESDLSLRLERVCEKIEQSDSKISHGLRFFYHENKSSDERIHAKFNQEI
jgi:flagellar biosynthesis protein FlhG